MNVLEVASILFYYATQWQTVAMAITVFLLLCRALFEPWYFKAWRGFSWKKPYVLLAVAAVSTIFFREFVVTSFAGVQAGYPQIGLAGQLVMWISSTHLRSILFFSVTIFYLWRKFNSLVPAMIVGWFALGVVELSYIPQLYISTGGFIGIDWYIPFIGAMTMYFVEFRRFKLTSRGFLAWFIAGLFFQYLLLIWRPYGITIWDPATHSFPANLAVLPVPPWQTWWVEFLNHLVKSLWAVAFCYVSLRSRPGELDKQSGKAGIVEQQISGSKKTMEKSDIRIRQVFNGGS